MKFYKCNICGQVVMIMTNTDVPLFCCGKQMKELMADVEDASLEKHVPVIEVNGDEVTVKIGSAPHPMMERHHIEWVCLQTKYGNQLKKLLVDGDPKACFRLCKGDEVILAYAYCNLHGLWKAEI